jgi:hypothetical protein
LKPFEAFREAALDALFDEKLVLLFGGLCGVPTEVDVP